MHTYGDNCNPLFCTSCLAALVRIGELPSKRVQNIGKHGVYYARGRSNG